MLAFIYDIAWDGQGRPTRSAMFDEERYWEFTRTGEKLAEKAHGYGLIPVVEVHRRARWGCYWDTTSGTDLVATTLFSMLMDLIIVRKLKTQSHIQLAYAGEIDAVVKDQVSDEESILMVQGQGNGGLQSINLESDPQPLLNAKAAAETTTAANHGISRARMNQDSSQGEDVALKERVTESAQVMAGAEQDVFRIARVVAAEHPTLRIAEGTKLFLNLGQLHNRVDRKTQLDVRREEKAQGVRSAVDDVLEDNPEFGGDRRLAFAYLNEKAKEQAIVVARQRALNMPKDATADQPGQDAEKNGALGPKVRDGSISKDEAADQAQTGA